MFRIVERIFVVVLLLSSMGVIDALIRPSPGMLHDTDVISTDVPTSIVIAEGGLYMCGVLLVVMRWRRVLNAARAVWPLLGLAALAFLSIAWSEQPLLTLRRSIFVFGSTLLGIYLGERYSMEKLARLLAQTLCLMMVIVFVLYFVRPSLVIDYYVHVGAWKGVCDNKNAFGGFMATAVFVLFLVRFRYFRWLRYVFIIAAVVLLVLSHSATGLACCVLALVSVPLWRLVKINGERRKLAYAVMALMSFLGMYVISGNSELAFQLLGRDSTFTGRTELWATLLPAISKHPILGYGYGAFWTGLNNEILNVWIRNKWMPSAADNGYIDLYLSLGALGILLFVYVFVHFFRMAVNYLQSESGTIAVYPITYLCFFAIHNVFESHLVTTRTLEFLIFSAISTSLALNSCFAVSARPVIDRERELVFGSEPQATTIGPWLDNKFSIE